MMAVREKYSHAKADRYKGKKRKEAEARTEARAARTDKQQLAKLDAEDWKATKERKRLQTNIDRRKRIENTKRDSKRN